MSDLSKEVLFGSFSEDETRSLLNQMPCVAQKADERSELPELFFGSFSNISGTQFRSPTGPGDIHPVPVSLHTVPFSYWNWGYTSSTYERKEVLFGSFSEDETRSLLNQMPCVAQKADERSELPELFFGSFSNISGTQFRSPTGPGDIHPVLVSLHTVPFSYWNWGYTSSTYDRKEVLFGSFSEDESRSWLNQMPCDAQKADERSELTELVFGSFSNIFRPPTGPGDIRPSATLIRDKEFSEKTAPHCLPNLPEDGGNHNSDNFPLENEVVDGSKFNLSDDNSEIDGKPIPEFLDVVVKIGAQCSVRCTGLEHSCSTRLSSSVSVSQRSSKRRHMGPNHK